MKKVLVVIVVIIATIYIGQLVYKTLCISCTTPPVKEYTYRGPVADLIAGFKVLASSNEKIKFRISDTLDYKSGEDAYAMTITVNYQNQVIRYDLIGENLPSSTRGLETRIKLTGANNLTNNKGGYGIGADGIQEILNEFQLLILEPLAKKQNIEITPLN
nr:hypothetical protein [uncultured Mucilaginibacter sp.]